MSPITEQLLRLIQSIPSPKAEPFKQWLARVGYDRIEETEDPKIAKTTQVNDMKQSVVLDMIRQGREEALEWHEGNI
jgi:hypothetical protein